MNLLFLLFISSFLLCSNSLPAQDPAEIVRKSEEKYRGLTSAAEITLETIRPGWKREMQIKAWSSGDDRGLILITSPARDQGVAYLRRGKEVWNWIPAIERIIKLPPSMMSQNWMGTDFTNDDLVEQSSLVTDYNHTILRSETIAGIDCHLLQLIPKPETDILWGKLLIWIDKNDFMQMKLESYDEDGELVNRMIASEIVVFGGRRLPARHEVIPADKPDHKTVMTYKNLQFDLSLDDTFFSIENMKLVR